MKKPNPYYDPAKYHHKPYGFRNPPGSPGGRRFTVELAREAAHFMGELIRAVHDPYPFDSEHVMSEAEALEGWRSQTTTDQVLWLGHASFLIRLGEQLILTDPYLSPYASPVPHKATKRIVPSAIAEEHLPQVDVIVISHNHYDHLDTVSLKKLAKTQPQATVVVPLGVKVLLKGLFDNVVELDWFDVTNPNQGKLSIRALPAVHTSKRGIGDTNRSLWCGFAIGDGRKQVYFAGDTAYGEVFKEIGEKAGPFDLGLVPIGAYQPRVLMRPVHATPEEAVLIGEDIKAARLIGMHWGTIRLTTEPMLEPKHRFLKAPGSIPRETLRIGETVAF